MFTTNACGFKVHRVRFFFSNQYIRNSITRYRPIDILMHGFTERGTKFQKQSLELKKLFFLPHTMYLNAM